MDQKGMPADAEYAEYEYNLYIYGTDDEARQISIDLPDADSVLSEVVFDGKDTLYVYANGCRNLYKVDIDAGTSEKLTAIPENCYLMDCREDILMCMTSEKIFLYDLAGKQFIEDATLDNFIRDNYEEMSWTGAGFTAYSFLGENHTIYVAGDKGLYRHVIGGGMIEQVMDGSLSQLGTPSMSIQAMTVNARNEFLTAYAGGKIIKAAYDAQVPAVPSERLTVYSLNDDDLVRQTISSYQAAYPEMYVEYQIGMDEGGVTREDALKKLNTEILGGSGPDVLLLDDMNIDTYVEKGVLMELSDVVDAVDREEGLYRNLIEHMRADGMIYAVPAGFDIPVIIGKKEMVEGVTDYQSMVETFERARVQYKDTDILQICSATGIMKRFTPMCQPAWRSEDGALDTAKIREFLELSRRLYDVEMNGTPAEHIQRYRQWMTGEDGTSAEDSPYFKAMRVEYYLEGHSPIVCGETLGAYTYREMPSVLRTDGFAESAYKTLNGQSANVYHPESIVGVNAATQRADRAKQFVGMMLGAAVQDNMQSGFSINRKSMEKQFACDESKLAEDGSQYSTSYTKEGVKYRFAIYPVEKEDIDLLEQWIASLDTPYLRDSALENAVYVQGVEYIEGRQELDETVKKIQESVEIYLSE
ncbi:MAG: extracellular solute-binding protein, partial [Lachnospiraceae bacterium]|nr:extracellular solute-binding protein [Lachnospiraceae bacterium]